MSTEEHTRIEVEYLLFMDKDGSMLHDDEGTFFKENISDSGTRGRSKLINRQLEAA